MGAAKAVDDAMEVPIADPDFIVHPDGTAIPVEQSRMREGFDQAGFEKQSAKSSSGESEEIHTVGETDVKTMEGSKTHPKRAVYREAGTNNPVKTYGDKFRNRESRAQRRKDNHLNQK